MKTALSLLGALGLLVVSARSDAGYTEMVANCSKNADNSGSCFGNFLGFRNSSDASARAFFNTVAQGTLVNRQFVAVRNTVIYSCTPAIGSKVESLWPVAQTSDYFSIMWNAAGQCTYLNVARSSAD